MTSVEELQDADVKESTLLAELTREDDVRKAISAGNWDSLRALSLLPNGFGNARVEAWQFLLNATPRRPDFTTDDTGNEPGSLGALDPHKDERQVGLDTERSFVLYPVDGEVPTKSKDELKSQLHHVIVHVLRKRPKLSYFQGYHDIVSVLMLTLNEEQKRTGSETDQELAATLNLMVEKLSLHRLRDSMGPGLEPLVGLLRLVKQIIRAVDPGYAKQLSTTSPLPYFALSNLLTYFSHDVPTLPLVQHIYDYLLSRPPIAIVYLAAVMILVRKEEVQTLFETGDEGMLHAVLCNLPELVDDLPPETEVMHVKEEGSSGPLSDSWHDTGAASPVDLSVSQTWTVAGSVSSQSWTAAGSTKTDSIPSPGASPTLAPLSNPPIIKSETIDSILDFPPLDPSSRPISPPFDEKPSIHQFEMEVSRPTKKKQPLSLITLLKQADSLFFDHPPQNLQVSQIMGPQSVIFTWCETNSTQPLKAPSPKPTPNPDPNPNLNIRSEFEKTLDVEEEKSREINEDATSSSSWTIHGDLISDDMAERMVLHPELVVRPWKDEDEMQVERETEMEREIRRKAAEDKALRKRRAKSHDSSLLGGGGKGSVIVVGGVVVVVVLGVVIAVYGKNGEWRKWVPRNTWLSRNAP